MTIQDEIQKGVSELSQEYQREVLDFVISLKQRNNQEGAVVVG